MYDVKQFSQIVKSFQCLCEKGKGHQYLVNTSQPVSCTRPGRVRVLLLAPLAGMYHSSAQESLWGWTEEISS